MKGSDIMYDEENSMNATSLEIEEVVEIYNELPDSKKYDFIQFLSYLEEIEYN